MKLAAMYVWETIRPTMTRRRNPATRCHRPRGSGESGENSPPGADEERCAALAVRRDAADHRHQRQRMPLDHRRATIELRATGGLVTRRSRPTASLTSLGAGVSVGGYANSRRRWIDA